MTARPMSLSASKLSRDMSCLVAPMYIANGFVIQIPTLRTSDIDHSAEIGKLTVFCGIVAKNF